jgi:hypothetical protein
MSWDPTDRLNLRSFLGTPTGQKLLPYLAENKPSAIPKEFREPTALRSVESLQLLGAYGYKSSGWEECTDFLKEMGEEIPGGSVAAFDYTNPEYDQVDTSKEHNESE